LRSTCVEHSRDVHALAGGPLHAGVEAVEIEHGLDQPGQPLALLAEDGEEATLQVEWDLLLARREHGLDVRADGCERRAQLAGDR